MNDLIERLRHSEKNYIRPHDVESLYGQAADHIESMTANEARLEYRIEQLTEALVFYGDHKCNCSLMSNTTYNGTTAYVPKCTCGFLEALNND